MKNSITSAFTSCPSCPSDADSKTWNKIQAAVKRMRGVLTENPKPNRLSSITWFRWKLTNPKETRQFRTTAELIGTVVGLTQVRIAETVANLPAVPGLNMSYAQLICWVEEARWSFKHEVSQANKLELDSRIATLDQRADDDGLEIDFEEDGSVTVWGTRGIDMFDVDGERIIEPLFNAPAATAWEQLPGAEEFRARVETEMAGPSPESLKATEELKTHNATMGDMHAARVAHELEVKGVAKIGPQRFVYRATPGHAGWPSNNVLNKNINTITETHYGTTEDAIKRQNGMKPRGK